MIIKIILSTLIVITGILFLICILLFGLKFCKEPKKNKINNPIWGLIYSFPYWIWIICSFGFQTCITQTLNIWYPVWCSNHEWMINLSSFIGFITTVLYVILIITTDENGNFKRFHKSK